MPRLICVFAGCTVILLVFSRGGSFQGIDLIKPCKDRTHHIRGYALTFQTYWAINMHQWSFASSVKEVLLGSMSSPVKWAATWQNKQNECAPSEDSDQPGHPPSLIRAFTVRMKKPWVLSLPTERTAKTLFRLGGYPGWSESSLGALSFCWFWHVVAQMVGMVKSSVNAVRVNDDDR